MSTSDKPPFLYTSPQSVIEDLRSTAEILRIGATKRNTNELLARKMEAAAYYLDALLKEDPDAC